MKWGETARGWKFSDVSYYKSTIPIIKSACGSYGKESTCDTGDAGLIPGSGRSPGEGHGNPLQYAWLENSMDRGGWQTAVHGVSKSQTWLSDWACTFPSWRPHLKTSTKPNYLPNGPFPDTVTLGVRVLHVNAGRVGNHNSVNNIQFLLLLLPSHFCCVWLCATP